MLGDKIVIIEMGVGGADTIDLLKLTGTERFMLVEAPQTFEQALAAQDLVKTGDAAAEGVRSVEEGGVAVRDLVRKTEHDG